MKGAIEKAKNIVEQNDNAFMPDQFSNPANPEIHRRTTGPEIWNALGEKIDFFVAGVGTGGTISGVSEFIKSKKSDLVSIAVEPAASPVISGGAPGPHPIQGIGAGFVPEILNTRVYDEIVRVPGDAAFETARSMAKREGLLVGISSGAAVWGALEVARRPESRDKLIVVMIPSFGERYLSTDLFAGLTE